MHRIICYIALLLLTKQSSNLVSICKSIITQPVLLVESTQNLHTFRFCIERNTLQWSLQFKTTPFKTFLHFKTDQQWHRLYFQYKDHSISRQLSIQDGIVLSEWVVLKCGDHCIQLSYLRYPSFVEKYNNYSNFIHKLQYSPMSIRIKQF